MHWQLPYAGHMHYTYPNVNRFQEPSVNDEEDEEDQDEEGESGERDESSAWETVSGSDAAAELAAGHDIEIDEEVD